MEGLSLDNMMTGEEAAALFDPESNKEETEETPSENPDKNKEENKETTEVVDVDTLFTDKPESVGSEDNKEQEGTSSKEETSPNFYSSIAKTFAEDGVFQDLNDEALSKVNDAESFIDLMEKQIQSKLDEKQRRIDEALNAGIEPTQVQRFENNIKILDSITDDAISEEGEKGENLRKNIIYEDYIQKGFSKERAIKAVERSIAAGTDIEDAKEALASNKEFFQNEYDNLVKEAQEEGEREVKERKEQAEKLKKSILEDNKVFGELSVDKTTRQKIYDNISKPIYKDPETGELYTAIQKYEMENRTEFLKNVGLLFTLTDGFKNLDNLVKNKVRKEVKKGLRELEYALNNTSRTSDGNLKFVSGVEDDPESFIGKDWDLDV